MLRSIFVCLRSASLSLIAVLIATSGYGQLLTYTTDVAGALSTVATNTTATPLSRVNGAATPGAPCGSGYSVSAFTSVTVFSPGLAAVEVTLTPDAGFTLNVTDFSAELRRSGSGPASVRFAYSTDGGATWIDQGTDQLPNNAACGITNTGTWTTAVSVPAPLALMFRIYGYNAPSASGAMQLLNLTIDGNVTASPACVIPPGLAASVTTSSSATLGWTAIPGALGYNIRYRQTGTTTWTVVSSAGIPATLTGLSAATVYECQVETICASGTSGYSTTAFFTTGAAGSGSASSGKMAIYFNHPVNTAVSTGVDAVYLPNLMDDTLIAYLNRAKYNVDIAQYNYNQSAGYSSIATAINNCITRGVRVRWIYDGGQSNTGIALLDPAVHTLASPTTGSYGIMHNKFVVIDANSSDPNDAIVSTGSTVWGLNQFNTDYNNIIFIQDSALAHAYQDQFNQMWGDTGSTPNLTASRFGPFKTDLGRHTFTIGGKTVELYFSPSDHTDAHIQSSINSAGTDLYFGVFTFTMASDANAIVSRNTAGVYTPGIVDQNSTSGGTGYGILSAGLGSLMKTQTGATIYHNKMMIVDPSNTCSDPLVLTGSHNWTNAAETKNDENTLIIHSDTVANIYYQSFHANYSDLGGTLTAIAPCAAASCGTPTGLAAMSVATTSALLSWAALAGALSYNVQYRVAGSSTWTSTTSAATTTTITGLLPATVYEFQVQAVCAGGSGSFSASDMFTTLAIPCSIPAGLAVASIDTDIATLTWVAVAGAVSYNVQYRATGATVWITIPTATNAITLSALSPTTTYEFQVQVVCASGTSAYSAPATFTTDTPPVVTAPCPAPVAALVPATSITGSSAMLHWQAVAGAAGYNVRYHIAGSGPWITAGTTGTTLAVSGLVPNATYEFQVQAVCATSGTSVYNGSSLFVTTSTANIATVTQNDAGSLWVFPNPATDDVTLQYHLSGTSKVTMSLYDVVGREVQEIATNEPQQAGMHSYKISIAVPGIYFVKLSVGGPVVTARVVKL